MHRAGIRSEGEEAADLVHRPKPIRMTQEDLEQIKAAIREMMTEFECPPCEEGVADDPAVLRTLPNQRAHPAGHAPPRRRGVQVLRPLLPLSGVKMS